MTPKKYPELEELDPGQLEQLQALTAEDVAALSGLAPEALAELLAPTEEPTTPPSAAEETETEPAEELVRARWVSVNPVSVDAATRIVLYGHELLVTPEQLADPETPAIAWDDAWVPDPDLDIQCRRAAGLEPIDPED